MQRNAGALERLDAVRQEACADATYLLATPSDPETAGAQIPLAVYSGTLVGENLLRYATGILETFFIGVR